MTAEVKVCDNPFGNASAIHCYSSSDSRGDTLILASNQRYHHDYRG